jgi:hypothetical protein
MNGVHNTFLRLTLMAVLVSECFSRPASAADLFELFRTVIDIPERGPVRGCALVTSDWKHTFLPPPGWNVAVNRAERELVLSPDDRTTSASCRLLPAGTKIDLAKLDDGLPKAVAERFPKARLVRELPLHVGGHPATAFDLEVQADQDVTLAVRLVLAQLPSGTVEFRLAGSPGKVEESYFAFGCLLSSFHPTPLTAASPRQATAVSGDR